jgi:hypothetical protein
MQPDGARMIKLDTTFVVGAGASVDYGFPLGEPLTKRIAEALNMNGSGDNKSRELIRTAIEVTCQRPSAPRDMRQLFLQARVLQGALSTASSIDAFLDNHADNQDFELLGKLAIASCLITAECQSPLRPRSQGEVLDLTRVEKSWLSRLFKTVIAPGVSKASVEQIFDHVSFVVFNYDRCIEHYLEHAIASHFLLDLSTAASIVGRLRIVHPYGDLGMLRGSAGCVFFGQEHNPGTHPAGTSINAMSQRLLTFTESKKAQGAEAKAMISKAKRLVFLGFGFCEQNVELLRAPGSTVEHVRATVMGLSKSSRTEVLNRIGLITDKGFGLEHLHDCDCTTLIDDEQMFLARGT